MRGGVRREGDYIIITPRFEIKCGRGGGGEELCRLLKRLPNLLASPACRWQALFGPRRSGKEAAAAGGKPPQVCVKFLL